MKTLSELTAYWLTMPTVIPGIKLVTVGRDEQALDNQTMPGLVNYPHLRVDTPSVTIDGEYDSPVTDFTYQIFLFAPVSPDNPTEENAVLSTLLTLMQSVLLRLWQDADEEVFDIIQQPKKGDAIRAWSGDNCFGWTMEVKIRLYTGQC